MLSVSFEGLCAFQCGTQVVAPEIHRHKAILASDENSVDVAKGDWSPTYMFKDPATQRECYIWSLTGLTVTLGNPQSAPTWKPSKPKIPDFAAKHTGKKSKKGITPLIRLGSGHLSGFDYYCFEWTRGGTPENRFEFIPERILWEGDEQVALADGRSLVLKADPKFAISNTFPEPNGLHHFSAYYELFEEKVRREEQHGLRDGKKNCGEYEVRMSTIGSGNCTPCGDFPCPEP